VIAPRYRYRGTVRPFNVGDQTMRCQKAAPRPVKGAYMEGITTRQMVFALLFQKILGVRP
ncbi:MAG TPA: hypothetical protein VF509_12730, partial [Sphingobium sp.]